jgi:hypothetical protein
MVFPKVFYHHDGSLCGASGVAPDLAAPTNDAGMEDWTHNRNPCSQLDLVPNYDGIHPYSQGVLHAHRRALK